MNTKERLWSELPDRVEDLKFGGSQARLAIWLLFVLSCARRTGLLPVTSERLHLILFYGAVLTPVYDLDEPIPLIVKVDELPYYPEAQEQIERLIVAGLVTILGRRRIGRYTDARKRRSSDFYDLSMAGLSLVHKLRCSKRAERLYEFILDLCKGFSELNKETAIEISSEDAMLRSDNMKVNDSARLKKAGGNKVLEAVRWLSDYEDAGFRPNRQDEVALYFNYLSELRRGAA